MFFPAVFLFGAAQIRAPLPEALLTESATDIDAEEAGELEFEANAGSMGARAGGRRATFTSLEVEWRVLREVGLRLEPSYARIPGVGGSEGSDDFGVGGALAFGLFHDFPRDLHLQAELVARTPEGGDARIFEPSEAELPFAADLVAAARTGRWTWRGTIGAEAGGSFAHAPAHTDLVVLTPFADDARFGFFGLEVRADWARAAPLVLAPDIVAVAVPLGLPFTLSVALPVNVGAGATDPSYGIFVRLMLVTSREVEGYRRRAD